MISITFTGAGITPSPVELHMTFDDNNMDDNNMMAIKCPRLYAMFGNETATEAPQAYKEKEGATDRGNGNKFK